MSPTLTWETSIFNEKEESEPVPVLEMKDEADLQEEAIIS